MGTKQKCYKRPRQYILKIITRSIRYHPWALLILMRHSLWIMFPLINLFFILYFCDRSWRKVTPAAPFATRAAATSARPSWDTCCYSTSSCPSQECCYPCYPIYCHISLTLARLLLLLLPELLLHQLDPHKTAADTASKVGERES